MLTTGKGRVVVELNKGSIRGGEHDMGEGHNKGSGNSLI